MLPLPGDPLATQSGKVVKPATVDVVDTTSDEANLFPKIAKFVAKRELSLEYLPETDYRQMAGIASVITLRLMGLSDVSISEITGAPVYVITEILEKPSTQQTFELIYKAIINRNAVGIHGRISSYATDAVDVVVGLMNKEDAPAIVRLKAAQDVLDRSGTNAEQVFGINDTNKGSDELNIVIMNEGEGTAHVEVNIKR